MEIINKQDDIKYLEARRRVKKLKAQIQIFQPSKPWTIFISVRGLTNFAFQIFFPPKKERLYKYKNVNKIYLNFFFW